MGTWSRWVEFWRRHPLALVLILAVLVRLAWVGVAQVGVPFQYPLSRFTHATADGQGYIHTPVQAVDMWTRWDAVYYLDIAREGYDDGLRVAFFPLWPLAIRACTALTGWWDVTCGLLLANLFDVCGWCLVALLARRRLGVEKGLVALLAFALFPSRNFGFSVYTEGLFLCLSAGAFYLYETRRFAWAAALCAVVSALRPQGVLVGTALAIDGALAFRRKSLSAPRAWQLAPFLLTPLGLLAYMGFLGRAFGRPLYFLQVQSVWHRQLSVPLRVFFTSAEPHEHAILLASVALFLGMIAWRRPARDIAYVGLSLLVPMCTGSMMSVPRFVGVLFPLFFFAAEVVAPKSRWGRFYVAAALAYCCVMAFKIGQGAKVI